MANYEQALAALQHLSENPATMRQAIDLHVTVRVALYPLGAFTQILPHLRAAKRLAAALGDPQRLEIFPPSFPNPPVPRPPLPPTAQEQLHTWLSEHPDQMQKRE